jgi:hypothetical protein
MPSGPWEYGRTIKTSASGEWSVNFSMLGQDGEPTVDIVLGMNGGITEYDVDGDNVGYGWHVPNPRITAYLSENRIDTIGWPLDAALDLTITNGGGVPYQETQTPSPWQWDQSVGYANFELGPNFTLAPGQVVTISNGLLIKTLTVIDLYVDAFDPVAKTVSGYSNAESTVRVSVWDEIGSVMEVTPENDGRWVANFNPPPDTFLPWTQGDVTSWDDDGDATSYRINMGKIN